MANKSCARAHQKSAENTTWYDINWTNCLTNANRWFAISIFVLIKMDFSVKPLETLWALMEPWLLRGLWLPAQIGDPDSPISHGQCHRKWLRLGTFGRFCISGMSNFMWSKVWQKYLLHFPSSVTCKVSLYQLSCLLLTWKPIQNNPK